MKQTAVEWLADYFDLPKDSKPYEQAKQMEAEQKGYTEEQINISDEEIYDKAMMEYKQDYDDGFIYGFYVGAKWYRKQLQSLKQPKQ